MPADHDGSAAAEPPTRGTGGWWRRARPAVLLVLGGVSLYLLLPSLLSVFGSWRSLSHLDWPFAILAFACEIASYLCLWEVDRIVLGTRAWLTVAAAQLSGFAAAHVLPGGGATSTAVTASVLRKAGVADTGQIVTALGAASILQMATTFSLPVLALPAILGGATINHSLEDAAYLGAAVLVALLAAGTAAFVGDTPVELAGRAIQWLINATIRRHKHVTDIPQRLLVDRDFVRSTAGRHWKTTLSAAVGNTVFDYLALLAALHAVGADPRPSLVVLAYVAGELLALLPFTPGGLGFVEAGLVGTLTIAGVPSGDALAATLFYRIVAYWLPLLAGSVAYLLFRHRYGSSHAQS
ncbi:lysylphosphatidylglycerol synthase transmembrane domain-containing protein [Kribbella capetownensis]|uniref:lysylphosphatidylglycerol synthase transmembrane domain-containing protein n=1 Tax=Kribbella capetownensis TaxID=1572659 RepID=UPI0013F47935|nr:YbhN family protein [Kribbella capetownensis]